jgi:transcriptional regulator with XRE-family HTH domain
MKTHSEVKQRLLTDDDVRVEYEHLEDEHNLRRVIVELRNASGLTQHAVAEKLGTYQSALSRLESGRTGMTIDYLARLADALDSDLTVCFTPRSGERRGQRMEANLGRQRSEAEVQS